MKANIEAALIYISANFREPLAVKMLADIANLSEFHFHRVFKQETHTTPQKYIERLRMEHAAHFMVLNPQIKKIHLAFESGFQSPASFNRSFKKYFKRSPSQYLRSHIQNREISDELRERLKHYAPLDICFLQEMALDTQLLTPEEHVIDPLFDQYHVAGTSTLYGIFLDPPLHMAPPDCRYLLGTEAKNNVKANFRIESGYYLRIATEGTFSQNIPKVLEQHQRLEQSGYRIKQPMGIEKMRLDGNTRTNYTQVKRDLFVPITK